MADITQTRANVTVRNRAALLVEVAGEAMDQGMPIYEAGGKWWKAQATEAKHNATRMSMSKAASDGFVVTALPGAAMDLGATLVVGTTYVVSANNGGIAPLADLGTTDWPCILGTATAANAMPFNPQAAGVAKP